MDKASVGRYIGICSRPRGEFTPVKRRRDGVLARSTYTPAVLTVSCSRKHESAVDGGNRSTGTGITVAPIYHSGVVSPTSYHVIVRIFSGGRISVRLTIVVEIQEFGHDDPFCSGLRIATACHKFIHRAIAVIIHAIVRICEWAFKKVNAHRRRVGSVSLNPFVIIIPVVTNPQPSWYITAHKVVGVVTQIWIYPLGHKTRIQSDS